MHETMLQMDDILFIKVPFTYCNSFSHLNRALYTSENKPRLTIAAAYIGRERNRLYEYGLY